MSPLKRTHVGYRGNALEATTEAFQGDLPTFADNVFVVWLNPPIEMQYLMFFFPCEVSAHACTGRHAHLVLAYF